MQLEDKYLEPIIRPVMMKDLKEVLIIEEQCFKKPWNPSVFFLLSDHRGHVLNHEGEIWMLVAEVEKRVVAYVVWEYEIQQKSGHLLNLAVQDEHRRKGIAGSLFSYVLDSLRRSDVHTCYLEVRESNTPARRFYEKMGIASISRSPYYYEDEDAIIYQFKL